MLSVIIPTYDTAAMTLRCCRAVLGSAPAETEVIVADDGSRDGTAELLAREVPDVRVVRLEANSGYSAAVNAGVNVARGEILLLLNSDAMVDGDALHSILCAFADDPKLGVASPQLVHEDGTPQWTGGPAPTLPWLIGVVSGVGRFVSRFRKRGTRGNETRDVDWVSGAAMALRREVWNAAGPLSEQFRFYCQDIELCVRAKAAGWRVRILGNARVTHAIGGTVAAGQTLSHDPAILWPDLLDWGALHYGQAWTMFARAVLVAIAAVRVVLGAPGAKRGLRALAHKDS